MGRRNLLTLARDLGRFPSELFDVGASGFVFEVRPEGWLGRFLRFAGTAKEVRRPIGSMEYTEMLTLYQIESEEAEKERALAEQHSRLRGMP